MALIKCTECGKEISDKATACPHCGCPVVSQTQCHDDTYQPQQQQSKPLIPIIIALTAYIILTVVICNIHDDSFADPLIQVHNDMFFCYLCYFPILLFLTPSFRDYWVCALINIAVGVISYHMVESLMFGAAVIIFLTNLAGIVITAIRRSDAINKDTNNTYRKLPIIVKVISGIALLFFSFMIYGWLTVVLEEIYTGLSE